MRLLLDTHIRIWSLQAPSRLAGGVAEALESPATGLWLSPISVWELALLADMGRIDLEGGLRAWVDEAMRVSPMKEAPLTHGVIRRLDSIETPHRNPADRFLVATAALDLRLVTSDERLLAGRGYRTLANR